MGWLACPAKQQIGTRADFIAWAEKYLLPESGLDCTALELYAARCGALHTMSPESQLAREGKARRVLYAWGTHDAKKLELAAEKVKGK